MLDRLSDILGKKINKTKVCVFKDIQSADPSLISYPLSVCQKGLMQGSNELFGYHTYITQEEVITTLVRVMISPEQENILASSSLSQLWYTPYLTYRTKQGHTYTPLSDTITRGAVIDMLMEVLYTQRSLGPVNLSGTNETDIQTNTQLPFNILTGLM